MSLQGCANLHNQWSIIGEFNNLPQEELIHWIRYNTRPGKWLFSCMYRRFYTHKHTLCSCVQFPFYMFAFTRMKRLYKLSQSIPEVQDTLWQFCHLVPSSRTEDPSNGIMSITLCNKLNETEKSEGANQTFAQSPCRIRGMCRVHSRGKALTVQLSQGFFCRNLDHIRIPSHLTSSY